MYKSLYFGIIIFLCFFLSCKNKNTDEPEFGVAPKLKLLLEDSGLDNWSRYWIGNYLYTDNDSVLHTTLNCVNYTEFPGYGHRRIICIDTTKIMRFHSKYFCDICVGDSIGYVIASMILRNEKSMRNHIDEQDDLLMNDN